MIALQSQLGAMSSSITHQSYATYASRTICSPALMIPSSSTAAPPPKAVRASTASAVQAFSVSEIIPRVYISDLAAAESPALIRALGITHVVSAMNGSVRVPVASRAHHLQLHLDDHPFAELVAHLPASTAFIRDALRSDPGARVLVHCAQGISRSSSVVAGFLVAHYGWTPVQAVAYVKARRPSAEPNFGFVSQLHEYSDKIRKGGN